MEEFKSKSEIKKKLLGLKTKKGIQTLKEKLLIQKLQQKLDELQD